ncbi:haloacid dehalogenase superfamily protein, subfamily IA, variant 3 with third motif having DD or ED [Terriglobus roseus DSM 18391]|uniref:Haloacid dehalogenase superfamily protein, subfamily IA, variant 3 with third motif having DD or ED n=1 Tax=Terriglobus roseus (strain DSM 18391 / NRRL B-41598 / KBS 63) TaxID=926566 RepID=I3ZB54_TERRK|nr:HAD family phosphatase [Terriglobus roseus]AFL86472.1 haloacid dehalogenase superfamily protein, subfamily IA, variant 3 with third motif having DD or ED [Terriglobus roseus DSM 18391]
MDLPVLPDDFRGLIFDCDGTLVETLRAHVQALGDALAPYGVRPTMEWARSKYGQSPATVLLAVDNEVGRIPVPHSEVLRAWAMNYGRNLHLLEQIAPVCDVARHWRGRVPMAVASNGHRSSVLATLEAVGLTPLFDAVATIEDVNEGKPAPDLFLAAARKIGVSPEDCVVFEDSEEGLEAAARAGMRAVRVPAYGAVASTQLERPA